MYVFQPDIIIRLHFAIKQAIPYFLPEIHILICHLYVERATIPEDCLNIYIHILVFHLLTLCWVKVSADDVLKYFF